MWRYNQTTGKLYDPDNNEVAQGYAGGNCGKNPEGINNPSLESVHSVGPLPKGLYTFGDPVEHSHLGPFAIPLSPDPKNEMFGRSEFFMHGDTTPSGNASQGCIIMPQAIRRNCWSSDDHQIEVF